MTIESLLVDLVQLSPLGRLALLCCVFVIGAMIGVCLRPHDD